MTYSEKLKDPRWQKRRLKVFEYAHWRCQICGCSTRTLNAHHSYYKKGKEPWQYPEGAIIAVCDPCHSKIHPERKPPQTYREAPPEPPDPRWEQPVEKAHAENRFAAMKAMLES